MGGPILDHYSLFPSFFRIQPTCDRQDHPIEEAEALPPEDHKHEQLVLQKKLVQGGHLVVIDGVIINGGTGRKLVGDNLQGGALYQLYPVILQMEL